MSKSCRIGYRPASDRLYSQTHAVSMFSSESSAPASIANAPLALSESARMAGSPAITDFRLDNGLSVVVIPDRRAPVVTHMVWYRNGSADDPPGKSGIAHFLEHLMFKGTKAHPQGQFSEVIAELGGQENAFTGNDYTAYFQRVAKEHLGVMMEFEADRMTGLVLTDEIVAPERDVVLEERRMHCDADPGAQLNEAVQAALFTHHPYGAPIIGWSHEIEGLNRTDALAYYQRFYTPENAILIVAGDVEAEEVRRLAEAHYGKIRPRGEPPQRNRPQEPAPVARRLVTLNDEKVEQPSWQRCYIAPSFRTAQPGEAEALEVLAHLLGGGQTSLLYRALVLDQAIAVVAGAHYMGTALDETRFFLYAMPNPGVTMEALDKAIDGIVARLIADGVDAAALERAKTRLVADAIYAQDSQVMLARWYGSSLATGLSMEDIRQWPARIEAVDAASIVAAARKHLDRRRAVTGHLLPAEEAPAA
jgi:zinc protease